MRGRRVKFSKNMCHNDCLEEACTGYFDFIVSVSARLLRQYPFLSDKTKRDSSCPTKKRTLSAEMSVHVDTIKLKYCLVQASFCIMVRHVFCDAQFVACAIQSYSH